MSLTDLTSNLNAILPLIFLLGWACVLLLVDLFIPKERKSWTALLAAIGLLLTLGISIARGSETISGFGGMVTQDGFSTFLNLLFLGSGLLGIAVGYDYLRRMGLERGEYYSLLLFSIGGMMLMAQATDLIIVFLALEMLSFPLYVLAGFARDQAESEESALKYFLMGAFASGFVLYGVAMVFGASGSTRLGVIITGIVNNEIDLGLLAVGAALILVGLGFKVAAVPFHMWTPDVYQGAPTAVTAFMSVGAKAGGFAALLRIFIGAFSELDVELAPVFWVIAALTMFLGNILAIAQSNIKRLLAYSSIAHAGYLLMALVTLGNDDVAPKAVSAAIFYLVSYGITSFGAWAIVIAMEKSAGQGLALSDYAGLGKKYPLLAAAMAVFMFSFTGVPPTLGFLGKFYLFSAVVEAGQMPLAIIGVLTSLLSAYYYLRVIVIMYMQEGSPAARSELWVNLTAGVSAVAVVGLSLYSTPLIQWAANALLSG